MKFGKLIFVLLLVLGMGSAAFYFSAQKNAKMKGQEVGLYFLPGLLGKINIVSKIVITDNKNTTHLVLNNNHWVVQEKSDYEADFAKVKKLLLNLAEMETIESKTSKPENYGRLGVQNIEDSGEVSAKQIQLLDKAGNVMYTLMIGKNKSSKVSGGRPSVYVRKKAEAKSWLVSGKIEIPASQVDWLNKKIIDVSMARVKSIEIKHVDKSQLLLSKVEKADKQYVVKNLPIKAELKSSTEVESVARVLQNLSFVDVLSRTQFEASEKNITRVTFTTFNGLRLMAKIVEKNGKHLLWFDVKSLSDNEDVVKESRDLNARFALWVYEISSTKANTFRKKLEDLIKTMDKKG